MHIADYTRLFMIICKAVKTADALIMIIPLGETIHACMMVIIILLAAAHIADYTKYSRVYPIVTPPPYLQQI